MVYNIHSCYIHTLFANVNEQPSVYKTPKLRQNVEHSETCETHNLCGTKNNKINCGVLNLKDISDNDISRATNERLYVDILFI